MLKQAALEMWHGFSKNIRTWKGIGWLAFMIFISWGYIASHSWIVYVFALSYLTGCFMPMFAGSGTGKLIMILPLSPKERRKLFFCKRILSGNYFIYNSRNCCCVFEYWLEAVHTAVVYYNTAILIKCWTCLYNNYDSGGIYEYK